MFNENHGTETKHRNLERDEKQIRNQIIHKTDWSKNRGDANGIWYVHAGEKKGTLKQLKLTMLVYKERHRNYFYHSKQKNGRFKQSHARILCCHSAALLPIALTNSVLFFWAAFCHMIKMGSGHKESWLLYLNFFFLGASQQVVFQALCFRFSFFFFFWHGCC